MNWLNNNFPNWRSFIVGLALSVAYALHGYLLEGTVHKSTIGVALLLAALGYVVKDAAVTGGKVAQTAEARARLEPIGSQKPNGNGGPFPPIQTKGLGMILFALIFSGAMVFIVAACGKRVEKIVNIPPGISEEQTQNWYKATGALAVVADNTKAATDLLVDLEHNGEIPAGNGYQGTLSIFGRIAQGGIVARNLLYQEPEHFTESTRQQIVSFAADALGQLGNLQLAPAANAACQPGQTCAQDATASQGMKKINDSVVKIQHALQQLQAMPGPSHTDNTSEILPAFRDTWDGVMAMRRAEGLLLIGRI